MFEGKAPDLKRNELAKRSSRREDAGADLQAAKEAGNAEDVEKYSKRTVRAVDRAVAAACFSCCLAASPRRAGRLAVLAPHAAQVRVTREHNEECKKLLRLMGVPVLDAPGEAEAQCAQLCKENLVYGMSTEDMDSLTFGTPKLIRHLMAPASSKTDAMEFDHGLVRGGCGARLTRLCGGACVCEVGASCKAFPPMWPGAAQVLKGLDLTEDQFIDLCILCGCDYTSKIGGIGAVRDCLACRRPAAAAVCSHVCTDYARVRPAPRPQVRALALVKKHGSIEGVLEALDPSKYQIPDPFPYKEARRLFKGANSTGLGNGPAARRACRATPSHHWPAFGRHVVAQSRMCSRASRLGRSSGAPLTRVRQSRGRGDCARAGTGTARRLDLPAAHWCYAEGLIDFLVREKTFAEERVRKAVDRINSAKGKASQGRLESFFGPAKVVSSTVGKRKEAPVPAGKKGGGGAAKKGKLGGMGKKK